MKRVILAAALIALCAPGRADPAVHYAPAENLETIDVALIDTAMREIDLAAYVVNRIVDFVDASERHARTDAS